MFGSLVFVGIVFASLSAILGGGGLVFTRLALPQTDAFTLTFLRWSILSVILFIIYWGQLNFSKISKLDRFRISLLGLIYFAGFPILLTLGLTFTTAGRAGLVFATMPIWTLIIASIFRIEPITKIKLFAIFVAILGVFIALGDNFNETNILLFMGDAIVMLGVICSSIFAALSSKYIEKHGNINVLLFALISGVSAVLLVALILGTPFNGSLYFNPLGWFYVLVLGIPCGAVMIFCWGKALQHASPTQATLCMGFHPLTAMLLGSLLLEEQITLNLFIGFFLVFIAIFFIQIKSKN